MSGKRRERQAERRDRQDEATDRLRDEKWRMIQAADSSAL